jgi:HrpA-like RNA helicase
MGSARILYVEGRQHPVKVFYAEAPQADYVESALRTFFQIHIGHGPGDVLVFLSGSLSLISCLKPEHPCDIV